MGLFKKKAGEAGVNTESAKAPMGNGQSDARIKILGSGCAKCRQLECNTLEALALLGMEQAVDHVTDFTQIAAYGVMSTPALVIDGKVAAFGKVLKTDEIAAILKNSESSLI